MQPIYYKRYDTSLQIVPSSSGPATILRPPGKCSDWTRRASLVFALYPYLPKHLLPYRLCLSSKRQSCTIAAYHQARGDADLAGNEISIAMREMERLIDWMRRTG